jgi:hypothetical protein
MHSHLPLTPSVLSVHAFFFSVLDLFIVPAGLLRTTVRVNPQNFTQNYWDQIEHSR